MNSDDGYTASGFDGFLSRGDTPNLSGNLDQQSTANNAVAFDRTQISGTLGDVLTIGSIKIDGVNGTITLNDGNTDRLIIGFQKDGF